MGSNFRNFIFFLVSINQIKNTVNTYLREIITQKKREQKRILIKSFLISIINLYFLLISISIFEDSIIEGEWIIFENLKELSKKL